MSPFLFWILVFTSLGINKGSGRNVNLWPPHKFDPKILTWPWRNTSLPYQLVNREEWGGRPPTEITDLALPVPYVVIHHSSVPGACYTNEDCQKAMRSMQNFHQLTNKWADIGYNFAVGGDGLVYEGRGWNRVGAHATPYNFVSIGIVLIGHWVSELPPEKQLQTAKELIKAGVDAGYIKPDYTLLGHRQVSATECPGKALYHEISKWEHFSEAITY